MASRKGKAQFYVFYLGWKECRGIRGREFVEPIIRELISRRLNEELPKLTIEATRKELKIMQLIEKRKGKVEKLKYPPIPTKDVTYAVQALSPDEDVVACIYLGYNPQTRAAVHVHVYRCDSSATASFFVDHLTSFISLPEHQERTNKIESELVAKGQVYPAQSTYGIAASEAPPSIRYDFNSREDPYGHHAERRPYSSRESIIDPYSEREMRAEPPKADYRGMPTPREDPYSLQDFRRNLTERRTEPPRQNGLPGGRSVFAAQSQRENVDPGGRSVFAVQPQREAADPAGRSVFAVQPQRESVNPAGRSVFPTQPQRETVDPYHEQDEVYQSVTAELKAKLRGRSGEAGPLLLPVKDYDTVRRKGGNLDGIEERRSRNKNIIGSAGEDDDHSSGYNDRGSQAYNDPYQEVTYQRWRNSTQDTSSPDREYRGRARSPEVRHPYGHPARAASPEGRRPYYGDDDRGGRRGRSPTRGKPSMDSRLARAMSPPPGHELRNTYFPNDEMLPNYLAPNTDYGYAARAVSPGRRAASPSRRPLSPSRRGASPPRSRYSGGSDEGGRRQARNPKYTASSLGLKPGGHPPRGSAQGRPRSDEGYLSMDRENPYRGYNDPYEDRHAPGGYPRNNDSPPPREVIAGDMPHRELSQAIDPNLPGSNQSFLY